VTEIRFHREIYDGKAVDAAVKVYEAYAQFELREEASHWVVQLTASDEARERRVAGELGNYALGLTMRDRVGVGSATGTGGAGQ
jgi:hypothetical protein